MNTRYGCGGRTRTYDLRVMSKCALCLFVFLTAFFNTFQSIWHLFKTFQTMAHMQFTFMLASLLVSNQIRLFSIFDTLSHTDSSKRKLLKSIIAVLPEFPLLWVIFPFKRNPNVRQTNPTLSS